MNRYRFYFEGYAEYIADSIEEAQTMFDNDHFSGYAMDIEEVEVNDEVEEND